MGWRKMVMGLGGGGKSGGAGAGGTWGTTPSVPITPSTPLTSSPFNLNPSPISGGVGGGSSIIISGVPSTVSTTEEIKSLTVKPVPTISVEKQKALEYTIRQKSIADIAANVKKQRAEAAKAFEEEFGPQARVAASARAEYLPLSIVTPSQQVAGGVASQFEISKPLMDVIGIPKDVMVIIKSNKPPLYPHDRPIFGSGTLGMTTENVTYAPKKVVVSGTSVVGSPFYLGPGTLASGPGGKSSVQVSVGEPILSYFMAPKPTYFEKMESERPKQPGEAYIKAGVTALAMSTIVPAAQLISPWSTLEERASGALGVGLLASPALLPAKIIGPLFTGIGAYGMATSAEGAFKGDVTAQMNFALSGLTTGAGALTSYYAFKPPTFKVTKLTALRERELKIAEGWKGKERPTQIDVFKAMEPKTYERTSEFTVKDIQNAIKLKKWNIEEIKTNAGVTARKGIWTGYEALTITEKTTMPPEIPELITMVGKGKASAFKYTGPDIGGMGTIRMETLYPVKILPKIAGSGTQLATFAIPQTSEAIIQPFPLSVEAVPKPTFMNFAVGLGGKMGGGQITVGDIDIRQITKPAISFDMGKDTSQRLKSITDNIFKPSHEAPIQIFKPGQSLTQAFDIAQEFKQERPTITTQVQKTRQIPVQITMPNISGGGGFAPAWSIYGPNFGQGRRQVQPKATRQYRYVPSVAGLMSGRTITRVPKITDVGSVGFRYPVASKSSALGSFKSGFMQFTNEVRGFSGGVKSFFGIKNTKYKPKPMRIGIRRRKR